jgi:DUF4097 and DUF4098 domain-containing protein YvlB
MKAAAYIAVALLWAQPGAAETVEQQAPADARGEVEITSANGDIEVRGWDRAQVQVRARLDDGRRLAFQNDGKRTIVKVVSRSGRTKGDASIEVRVPRESSLFVSTIGADVRVQDVHGAQAVQTVSGFIDTQMWSGDVDLKTVSGDIDVRGYDKKAGPARVRTVSGRIRLDDIGNELDLHSVSGDVDVRAAQLTRARIKTTNGDLELRAALARDARIDAEALNGTLRFILLGKLDVDFDVETFNGDISNCFGPQGRTEREFGRGHELHFKQGEGNARMRIKTFNGEVEICDK